MSRLDELKQILSSVEADFDKFYNNNNQAAGTRIRKAMQDLKKKAQDVRSEVQEIKNSKSSS
jgi:hypothetical protein